MSYRFLEHSADVKFRADGVAIEDMFVSAFDAFSETVYGDIKILEQDGRVFEIEGEGEVSLLYNFLSEVLRVLNEEDFLVARVEEIEVGEGRLKCVVVGDRAENYSFTNDVKAVVFSEMFVREEDGEFLCQVVLRV